jgi:hypothetical protein
VGLYSTDVSRHRSDEALFRTHVELDAAPGDEVRAGCHLIVNCASNLANNTRRNALAQLLSSCTNDSWVVIIII